MESSTNSWACCEIFTSLWSWITGTKIYRSLVNGRGKKEFLVLFVSWFLFVVDIITDIIVAVEYRHKGDTWWFVLTLCFILLPLIIITCIAFYQIVTAPRISERHVILGAILTVFLSSVFSRFFYEFMLLKQTYWDNGPCNENNEGCRCTKCKVYKEKLKASSKSTYNLAWIQYVETMAESAPQWCLQVYVMFRQWYFPWYTLLSVIFSFLSLAWSVTALERARARKDKSDLTLRYSVLHFFYELFGLFSRLFAIVIFAYVFKMYILLVFGFHLLAVSLVLRCVSSHNCGYKCCKGCGQCMQFCRPFIYSFPFLFHASYATLKSLEIDSRVIYFAAYGVISVENFIMTITAVFRLRSGVAHLGILGPIALSFVTTGLVLGAVLSVVYYFSYNKPKQEPPPCVLFHENEALARDF